MTITTNVMNAQLIWGKFCAPLGCSIFRTTRIPARPLERPVAMHNKQKSKSGIESHCLLSSLLKHHSIKKKIDALSEGATMKGGASEDSEAGAPTPAKASSKKRKSDAVKTEGEDGDGAEAEATPAKTPKKARKASTKVKGKSSTAAEEDGEADEGQDMPSDVKSEINEQEDYDVESNFDESPADGYFEQRSHPQETYVENSSVTAAADAKAREAAEARAGSSSALPPSQISSVASSPRSATWTDIEIPFAVNTDAPPPDYESATANSPARSTSRPFNPTAEQSVAVTNTQQSQSYGTVPVESPRNDRPWPIGNLNNPFNSPGFPFGPNGFPAPFGHEPITHQSMSDPAPKQGDRVDEETGLLNRRRQSSSKRKPSRWRQCCKPISTCNAILVVAIVVLIVFIAGNADDWSSSGGRSDGNNPRQPISPPVSPTPSTLPSPTPFVPPSHGTCVFDYHTEPAVYEFSKVRNFSFIELIESSNYITGGIIGRIQIKPAESDQSADLKLSITYATTGPWKVQRPTYDLTEDKFVLQMPELESTGAASTRPRACLGVYVDVEIRNGLRLENWDLASGNLDVAIMDGLFNRKHGEEQLSAFDEADPESIKPADFVVATSSGSVHVEFPTTDLPVREYQTRIETQSGNVGGTYILGAFTSFHTQSGSVKPRLAPVFNSTAPSKLRVDTKSASQTVSILRPHQYPGDFAQLMMEHKYTSFSGSLHLTYPQEWEGYIEGETMSGSIHVKGRDIHVLSQGKVGPVYQHFAARKGFGQGRIGFKTTSGSINVQAGDL
ncbi:hypothetical protein HII31_08554 [Pseudocercospora fuligena]|uniref:Uncharacterized protein n=1 Tax=Pseudocercospora fuligena TaxID=685502 RepID=A0A8H6RFZ4_9PEZI|nr:hypothetical protein HII31_08554 [Pseudocercospora fuligena]